MRRWRAEKTYSSNLDANNKSGIMRWTAVEAPFFTSPQGIVAPASHEMANWSDLLAIAIEGQFSVEEMIPCEAVSRIWTSRAAHQAFADEYFAEMSVERERVVAAIDETVLTELLEIPDGVGT